MDDLAFFLYKKSDMERMDGDACVYTPLRDQRSSHSPRGTVHS